MSELQSKSLPLLSNARLELASLRRRIVLRGDCPRCREALELIDSEIVRGQDRCCWCKTVFQLPEALVESRVKTLEAEAEAKKKEARRIVEARAAKRAEQAARLAEVRSRAPQLRTDTPRGPRWAILHQPVDKFLEWCLFAGILSAVAAVAVFLGWQVLKFGVFVVRGSSPTTEQRQVNPIFNDTTTEDEIETIVDSIMSTPEGRAGAQRVTDRDNQLTHFQRANGISDEVAEAAIMEWVVGHGGNFDWDLEDVKAICRRMQR